jgi:benzoate membrane transport protein
MNFYKSLFAPSNLFAAIISAAVGYSSSSILVYNAALHFGATPELASSWLGIVCLGMGLLTILLSALYKTPIMFAWSTAGAALLLSSPNNLSLSELYGAFFITSIFIIIFSASGIFEKMMNKIPMSLSHAMLAGILFKFVLNAFLPESGQYSLMLILLLIFLISRHFFPKLAIIIVAFSGLLITTLFYHYTIPAIDLSLTKFTFIAPTIIIKSIISISLPLFIVIMTSQNMAGIATLNAYQYPIKISKVLTLSGVAHLLTSFFGGFSINLSAITAAICMGPEAHPEKEKRYGSAIYLGIIYIILGFFAQSVGTIFQSLPKTLINAVTGFALINTVLGGLNSVFHDQKNINSSMLTFFVTASGVTILGIGSAFWGICFGLLSYFFLNKK